MIELPEVIYDVRARDGTWCRLPYPNHPKGCFKFPKCPSLRPNFLDIRNKYSWYAVMEEFDLKSWADKRKMRHPEYSERQARNLIYWQNGVRARLRMKAQEAIDYDFAGISSGRVIVLDIPEACGINVFETMAKVGIMIDRHPDIVRKVMLIGELLKVR